MICSLSFNFISRNRTSRRFPAVHPTPQLPGRLRHLLRADRVRPSTQTNLQRARLLQQLQPVLPPKTIALLSVENQSPRPGCCRPEPIRFVRSSESESDLPQVRLSVPRDAGQRAMRARIDVRRERQQDRISKLRLAVEATDRGRVCVRRAAGLPDATYSGRLQLKLKFFKTSNLDLVFFSNTFYPGTMADDVQHKERNCFPSFIDKAAITYYNISH